MTAMIDGQPILFPTDEERKTFDASHASMNQGWTGTLDQLAGYLAKARAN